MSRNTVLFVMLASISPAFAAERVTVKSPDGTVALTITAGPALSYSVTMDNQPILLDSALQLEFGDGTTLAMPLEAVDRRAASIDDRWNPVVGRKAEIRDHYHQAVLALRETTGPRRQFSLVCRAYDDGVAFRYAFGTEFGPRLTLHEEHTQWVFPGNPVAWPAFLNSFTTMHEIVFPREQLAQISPEDIIGLPLTVQLAENRYCSIHEASLDNWAGMYLTRHGKSAIWLETDEVVGGGQPYAFNKDLPEGAAAIRIIVDALGSNAFDHVDIVEFKATLDDGSTVWLSDLEPTQVRQEWGSLKKDKSVDSNPLTITGTVYEKGVGTHANAVLAYTLPKGSRRLSGKVGIDSEVGDRGQAKLRVQVIEGNETHEQIVLRTLLSRRNNAPTAVEASLPHRSPWRVIQVGRTPADLLNSDIILNLNEPCRIADTSWIKPGVSSWNWLSSGERMDMELLKGFIDLSAKMKWEYALIDDGWYQGGHQGDVTRPIAALDMPALVAYADERGVKLWVWTHWQAFDRKLDEALAQYKKWGIVGVKTDFMSRDDQWMVNWYRKVLERAAHHQIMIDFHGSYKPTGERRTWPNMMTSEAVFGNEQNLGSRANDPVHKTTLPFTRQLAGPMDYTPGSFLNETARSWRAARPVHSLGTRCQELALFVVFDSPFMCTADLPANYDGQDGADFLTDIPASWDDTKVLDGRIGEFILTARRKGTRWYLGGITNGDPRTVSVPLSFLKEGSYSLTLYQDGPDAESNARQVSTQQKTVSAGDTLSVKMASGGGFTAILTKVQ